MLTPLAVRRVGVGGSGVSSVAACRRPYVRTGTPRRTNRRVAPVEPSVSIFWRRALLAAGVGSFKAEHPGLSTSMPGWGRPGRGVRWGRADASLRGAPSSPAVADRKDLDFTYSLTDRIFRLSMGELADFSGAKYDGDFSLSLEQAQRRKHEYVAQQLAIEPGCRVLDLGCGWGALLNYLRSLGAAGVGVTLSSAQERACRRHGLDVYLRD